MRSLDRIRARRAAVVAEIDAARTRLAVRRRMAELEVELAAARHPMAHLSRHLPWLVPLVVVAVGTGRGKGVAGRLAAGMPISGAIARVLAGLIPILLRRISSR